MRTSRNPFSRGIMLCVVTVGALSINAFAADANRVNALLQQMTLEEKVGQMTQVDSEALKDKSHIEKYFLGSVLSGGGSDPINNTPQGWLKLANECQFWAQKTRLKIPLLYGVDAVHGHNNVLGAVIFPHNIGLGATRNPALVEAAARITAREVAGTGINWTFAPCVAVAQDPRWGRTYESFSDSPDIAAELGLAAVRGFQGNGYTEPASIMACIKHYVADGGTSNGVDQGNSVLDEATLRRVHLAPYIPSIKAGASSVMASFSSWNGQKMHGHKHLLTDVLKGELGFKGFVVSDWAGIDQLPGDYKEDIEASINAGLDMVMIPNGPGQENNYLDFITKLLELVEEKRVPISRIDDAVRRILQAKLDAGLFERRTTDSALTAAIGSSEHRTVARECVRESLVILKNQSSALPLRRGGKIAVMGTAADDLGIQCGGWTISWQGSTGNVTRGGTTLLHALRQSAGKETQITYSPDGSNLGSPDVIVVAIGEKPYAEMQGDRTDLSLNPTDLALVQKAKATGARVVTLLFSGRPLLIGPALDASNAFVAAWLPGTEGAGMADVLFGDFKPTGKLPRPWPKTDLVVSDSLRRDDNALFPLGHGLTYDQPAKTAATK